MRVKDGMQEAYRKRHCEVWPSVMESIRQQGVHNYSIYLDGQDLFAYLEVDDFDALLNSMAADPENRRWQESMAPIMEQPVELDAKSPLRLMEEVFHVD